jgi:hypothetical protein
VDALYSEPISDQMPTFIHIWENGCSNFIFKINGRDFIVKFADLKAVPGGRNVVWKFDGKREIEFPYDSSFTGPTLSTARGSGKTLRVVIETAYANQPLRGPGPGR